MSDEQFRSTEIEALMQQLSPDDPGPPVGTIEGPPTDGSGDGAPPTDNDTPVGAQHPRKKGNVLTEWIIVIIVAISAALLVRAFVLQQFAVSGHSMDTTLHNADRVLVNKLSYRMHDPNRGDVVVLKTIEGAGERDLIKRVVALPGETVEYRACVLYIDGRELVEPYLDPEIVTSTTCGQDQAPLEVPDDTVYVMGDNRGGSKDSRDLGPIEYEDLIGRAFVVIWPMEDWTWL
ncbi:MAG: signal peptidase I [Actinomycetota bacterium]|nr:signal peptidase I [Actinomycetota bacterium]